eukprot:gene12048-8300_t
MGKKMGVSNLGQKMSATQDIGVGVYTATLIWWIEWKKIESVGSNVQDMMGTHGSNGSMQNLLRLPTSLFHYGVSKNRILPYRREGFLMETKFRNFFATVLCPQEIVHSKLMDTVHAGTSETTTWRRRSKRLRIILGMPSNLNHHLFNRYNSYI